MTYFRSTAILFFLILAAITGCAEQQRFEWSEEGNCLADHYMDLCYESEAELKKHDPDNADQWEKGKDWHEQRQEYEQLRQRYQKAEGSK